LQSKFRRDDRQRLTPAAVFFSANFDTCIEGVLALCQG
jgi:hypothetical protein